MIPAEFTILTETNWEEMYIEYNIALKKIRRYKRHLQEENREIKKKGKLTYQQIQHRNIIYETEEGILETLKNIESYLTVDLYSNIDKKNKDIIHKNKEDFIPIKKIELIIDEIQKNQLYSILEKILSPEQFQIIILYYKMDLSQGLVAKELKISQQKVSSYLDEVYNIIKNSDEMKDFKIW